MAKAKKKRLTSKQARHLRGLGHHLSPLAMIGREGITKTLVNSVVDNLTAHELIKIKVQNNCPLDRKEAVAALAEAAGAQVAQVIGKMALLYRENADIDPERKIVFP